MVKIIMGYFFVVPGKLFAYSLRNFLQSHIEDNSPHLLSYKLWNWRSSVPSIIIVGYFFFSPGTTKK